jgi:quercetin 2,3-dioxygenase
VANLITFLIKNNYPTSLFFYYKINPMEKPISRVVPLAPKQNAPGFRSVDIFTYEHDIEPFLVFTEFHMDRPIFGPHPHAGVSVMTYMLPDSPGAFLNRDSRGDRSVIEPGGIHVTQAGSGVKHDEVPTMPGTDCHGFQIWINHADRDRLVAPAAYHAKPAEVPEWSTDGVHLRVIQGHFNGLTSPITLVTSTLLFHVRLAPHASVAVAAREMAFTYLMAGELLANGQPLAAKALVKYGAEGDVATLRAGATGAELMFASGTPHREPIVYGGPFVMTTAEQMHDTRLRLGRGEMGELAGL